MLARLSPAPDVFERVRSTRSIGQGRFIEDDYVVQALPSIKRSAYAACQGHCALSALPGGPFRQLAHGMLVRKYTSHHATK